MNARSLMALLGGALLATSAAADMGSIRMGSARDQLRGQTQGWLNAIWRRWDEKMLPYAYRHFVGAEDPEVLRSQARAQGEPISQTLLREIDRRVAVAEEKSAIARDGFVDLGINQFTIRWNNFTNEHPASEFENGGVPAVTRAFWAENEALYRFARGQVPPEFPGEPVSPGWLTSYTPDGAVDHGPVQDGPQSGPQVIFPVEPVEVQPPQDLSIAATNYGGPDLFNIGSLAGNDTGAAPDSGVVVASGNDDAVATPAAPPQPVAPAPLQQVAVRPETPDELAVPPPQDGDEFEEEEDTSLQQDPPIVDGDNDAQGGDIGWATVTIEQNMTLGELGVQIRRGLDPDKRPPLWGAGGVVDLLYQANSGHLEDPDVLAIGDKVRVPTNAWFTLDAEAPAAD